VALSNFIPTVWSARLSLALDRAQVYTQAGVVNRDYEGDIRAFGDSVRIGSISDPTVGNYTRNGSISVETLDDASQLLTIDQAKYFAFEIDDLDKAQMNVALMDRAVQRAGRKLTNTADTLAAGKYAEAGSAVGSSGSPKADLGTAGKAYEHLVAMGVELDEADVPSDGRWVIVPSWFHGKLLLDDRFVKAGTPASDAALRNGIVGEAAGFTILKSNNVSNDGTTYRIMGGTDMGISFAEQILAVEAYRPQDSFSDAVKGLYVYGLKVVRPECLVTLYANAA
jgi:hypothetical protein